MIDLEGVRASGEINDFFYTQLQKKLQYLPEDLQETLLNEAIVMSQAGVDSAEDQKTFWYISLHTPEILEEILDSKLNWAENIARVSTIVFEKRMSQPINTLLNFFNAVASAAFDLGLPVKKSIIQQLTMPKDKKLAYPQGFTGLPMRKPYNLTEWMRATRDIYARANQTGNLALAVDEVTKDWDIMEKLDYKAWLRFYQEGTQHKYKIAQRYYTNNDEGYMLPNPLDFDSLKGKIPSPIGMPEEPVETEKNNKSDVNDVRTKIEQQRAKIISRLNAAEKLLSSMDGQFFAGDDQEYMLKLLQDLKRKVQTANKITIKSSLFEDFIYRTANLLEHEGKDKASRFFYKVAQGTDSLLLPPDMGGQAPAESNAPAGGDAPAGDALADPSAMSPLGPPEPTPGDLPGTVVSDATKQTRDALKEFFDRLETGVTDYDDSDIASVDDKYASIIVEAQEAIPAPAPAPKPTPEPAAEQAPAGQESEGLEVSETEPPSGEKVDDAIEAALKNVSLKDVIERLELLANIYKKREIARQLAVIDLMMDRLGIGSFFPEMGEAMGKSLESNQYIGTRVDAVLSRLRGVYQYPGSDKIVSDVGADEASLANPGLRQALEAEQQKEQERKDRRKAREEARESGQLAPAAGPAPAPAQELAGPTTVERAAPPPIATR